MTAESTEYVGCGELLLEEDYWVLKESAWVLYVVKHGRDGALLRSPDNRRCEIDGGIKGDGCFSRLCIPCAKKYGIEW